MIQPPLPPTECVTRFLQEAQRLGIEVRWTNTGITNLDAAYHALPGAPQGRQLSSQQAEAYTAQSDPAKVLKAVSSLQPVHP